MVSDPCIETVYSCHAHGKRTVTTPPKAQPQRTNTRKRSIILPKQQNTVKRGPIVLPSIRKRSKKKGIEKVQSAVTSMQQRFLFFVSHSYCNACYHYSMFGFCYWLQAYYNKRTVHCITVHFLLSFFQNVFFFFSTNNTWVIDSFISCL